MDISTLSLSKQYTNNVAAGITAARVEGNSIILTLVDGSEAVCNLPVPADGKDGIDGKDGVSVIDLSIDNDGSLLCHMSDGTTIDAGYVPTVDPDLTNYYTKEEIDNLADNKCIIQITDSTEINNFGGVLANTRTSMTFNPLICNKIAEFINKMFTAKEPYFSLVLYTANHVTKAKSIVFDQPNLTSTISNKPTVLEFYKTDSINANNNEVVNYRLYISINWNEDVATVKSAALSVIGEIPYLSKHNITEYIPTANYHPATKKYVDDSVSSINVDIDELLASKNIFVLNLKGLSLYSHGGTCTTTDVDDLAAATEVFTKIKKGMNSINNYSCNLIVQLRGPWAMGSSMFMNQYMNMMQFIGYGVSTDTQENLYKLWVTGSWDEETQTYNVTGVSVQIHTSNGTQFAKKSYVDTAISNAITTVLEGEY